jgi:hypothetical protein
MRITRGDTEGRKVAALRNYTAENSVQPQALVVFRGRPDEQDGH